LKFWPSRERTFLDADDEQWVIETWGWFLHGLGGIEALEQTHLIVPTREYFPPSDRTGHERAEHIFEAVKRYAGMSEWPCRLIAQLPRAELRVGEVTALKPISQPPGGTFAFDGNEGTISYDPAELNDPLKLVAIFAHELAHYRLAGMREEVPGGEEMHEFATDLLTVYFGFGIFGANSAFNFSQHQDTMSQGWKYSRSGYLNERAWVFALALFLEMRRQSSDVVKPFMKSHLFADMLKARQSIERRGIVSQLLAG
jgi:hypothetical protein